MLFRWPDVPGGMGALPTALLHPAVICFAYAPAYPVLKYSDGVAGVLLAGASDHSRAAHALVVNGRPAPSPIIAKPAG